MANISEIFGGDQAQALKQDQHTPLYHQLYLLLKNAILNGTLSNGDQMPTELQLAEAFGVSRITAKRAMDDLAAENLVERRRAKGTHVTYHYTPQPVKAPLVGMLQEIESMGRHSDVKVLECSTIVPPADIRKTLDLEPKHKALRLVRIRLRDGLPFGHYASWTSGLSKKIPAKDFAKKTRLELFRKQGLIITHVTQNLSAIAATPELAVALDTNVGDPLLSLTRYSFNKAKDGTEHLLDLLEISYNPDRFQYQMDLNIE